MVGPDGRGLGVGAGRPLRRRRGLRQSIEIWFLDDDEGLATYHDFLERFEADEIALVGVFAGPGRTVFEPQVLAALDGLTEACWDAPHVNDVTSLANVDVIRARGGLVAFAPLMDEVPETPEAVAALARSTLADDLLRGNLVSADGRATAVIVTLDPAGNTFEGKVALVRELRRLAGAHLPASVEWELAGSPPFDEAFYEYSRRDLAMLGPVAFLLVLLATFLAFRRLSAVAVGVSVVALANLWTFGLMGALGIQVNMISSSVLALILAVGVADAIHVLSEYFQHLSDGVERDEAVPRATAALLAPCFFTSATTAAGFLALLGSDLPPIREFGWLAAVGVGLAFLLTMTFVPAVLRTTRPPAPRVVERHRTGLVAGLLRRLGRPTRRSSRRVVLAAVVVLGLSGLALTQLDVGANTLMYFREGDPVREAHERVDEALSGSTTLEFLVETSPQGLKDPAVLARLDDLAGRLVELPGIMRVLSILDALRQARQALTDGRPESAVLPDTPELAAQLYLMLEGDPDFRKLLQGEYSVTRMSARVSFQGASELVDHRDELFDWLERDFQDDALRVTATGYVKLMADMEDYLLESQLRSMALALLVVSLMMFLLLRSVRLGLLALIPNILPIVVGLAVMVLAGFSLDPGTIMIGPLCLGLVVDDTVHFLTRLRRVGPAGPIAPAGESAAAIARAMHETGRPILLTSAILAAGFGVLCLGSFNPNVAFGMTSAVVILLAVVADLVLLPAVLVLVSKHERPPVANRIHRDRAAQTEQAGDRR